MSLGISLRTTTLRMSGGDKDREGPPDRENDRDGQTGVVTQTRPKTKKPSLYNVVLLNDD